MPTHTLSVNVLCASVIPEKHHKKTTTQHLSSVEVRHDFKYSATRNILRIHTWAGRLSLATRLLGRYRSDNWRCALCGKINYATGLDQDYLHACHCACFRWFKLPCFVIWVTEKKNSPGSRGVSLQREWKGDDSEQKHTQMKWQRGGGNRHKGICRGSLPLVNRWLFVLSSAALKINLQTFKTELWAEERGHCEPE